MRRALDLLGLGAVLVMLLSNPATAEQALALRDDQDAWRSYAPSFALRGADLEIATDAVLSVLLRAKTQIADTADRAAFQIMAEYVIRFSAVDPVDSDGKRYILYNSLADVFALAEFDGGKLKSVEFASGANIAAALAIPDQKQDFITLVVQRPTVLAQLHDIMKKSDVSALFRKHVFDEAERNAIANGMIAYMKLIEENKDDPCFDFIRQAFMQERDSFLPDDRMSGDVKSSVKLLLRVGGETPVFVFGDTVIGRVRTFVLMEKDISACKTKSQLTQYIVD